MSKKLSYDETMEVVEEFMNTTGIREYCVDLCKGECCPKDCFEPCYLTGERRLMCSVFICLPLQKLIFDCVQIRKYNEDIRIPMSKIVAKRMKKAERNRKIETFPTQLVYFIPYSDKAKSKMTFPVNIVRDIQSLTHPDVIQRTKSLISLTKTAIRANKTKETKIVEEVRYGREKS